MDLLERLQEVRALTGDMMIGKTKKDLLAISIKIEDLIDDVINGRIKA
jgi:hypothetical protein